MEAQGALGAFRRLLVALVAIVMIMLSVTMAWAVAEDLSRSEIISDGVSVVLPQGGTVALDGLTRGAAETTLAASVLAPVLSPVTVRFQDRRYTLNPRIRSLVKVNTEAMVDRALRLRDSTTFLSRLHRSVTGEVEEVRITPEYAVDEDKVGDWLARIAPLVELESVDASRQVVGNRIVISPSRTGVQVRHKNAQGAIAGALLRPLSGSRTVSLPVTYVPPKIDEDSFGKAIVVDKSERTLYLYDGADLVKTYRVAVGMPGFPTPLGNFEIVQKRFLPTWSNPGSDWAKTMPAYIPPGPGNPLGTRALNLNAAGIRIHGTNKISSIGTAASHGCIRMVRHDVEELYELVKVGTPVYVVP